MQPDTGYPGYKAAVRAVCVLALGLIALAVVWAGGPMAAASVPGGLPSAQKASKIEPAVLQDTANGKSTSFIILLADQANVTPAYNIQDQDARGWYVYNTLRSHAERTQGPLKAFLDARGVRYQSYWVANLIVVESGDRSLVEALAARNDVGKIESNRPSRWIEDPAILNPQPADKRTSPDTIEWGVQNVNAPQVWAMGYTGVGIVVGNQDTGMRWTHLAIKNHYRGWDGTNADHNYNWWDAIHSGGGICGPNTRQPCDDNAHGTHTTGTAVGDDGAGNQIGVAPGAKWIGCRNMDQGTGTPQTYTECFQFFIAPTDLDGQNPDPTKRPHVMNNSWGCPPSEGCGPDTLRQIVENTQAAGIFVEASAGNAGPSCSTVQDPPAIYAASFSTGAINISNALASFSSRGPVTVDSSNRLKPNISAPGVNVRSSTNSSDTSYANFSGTSMAGPHVVGVVALLWEARPWLSRQITPTKELLQQTANPNVSVSAGQPYCGGTPPTQIPNNYFGYGRVDALAAVNASQGTPTPTVTGTPPTPTRTPTQPTPTATPTSSCINYVVATATATIVPGTVDIGAHCDDCVTTIQLPFPVRLYDQSFTQADVDSNGKIHFPSGTTAYSNSCLPVQGLTNTIFAFWDDLYLVNSGYGIYTSVTGTPPNRIFNIEWRAQYFPGSGTANFEVRLYENQSLNRFDIIYGTMTDTTSNTIGVQRDTTCYTQWGCPGNATSGLMLIFTRPGGTPVPTNTPMPPSPTNTPTRTSTPSGGTPMPTATPPCPPAGWVDRAPVPASPGLVRADAAYFPATGLVYVIGGRTTDNPGAYNQTIYTYNPATDTWSTASTVLTDTSTSNLAVALLNGPSGPRIYAIGGSPPSGSPDPTPSDIVRIYDPVTGSLTNGTPWPQNPRVVPGGWAVYNNKLYMFGGFDPVNQQMTDNIWVYDPMAGAGGSWTQSSAHLTLARSYIATQTIGNRIYLVGGSAVPVLTNEVRTEIYDPVTDSICDPCIPELPTASSNFRGYTDGRYFYAPGGVWPNSVNILQIYDTITNTWTSGPNMNHASRNYAAFTLGTNFYAIGGYDETSTITPWNQRYSTGVCPTPTATSTAQATNTPVPPSPTNTSVPPTATNTPSAPSPTPTELVCEMNFSDVPPTNPFYIYIRCLYCRGILGGYADGTFRPGNPTTRGQMAKIVANAAGILDPIPPSQQTYVDVPPSHPFWVYIERLSAHGIVGGYSDGTFRPDNWVTRGQMTKFASNAAGFQEPIPPGTQTYTDVPPTQTFYVYIERLSSRGIISGYQCGVPPAGPCDPQNRPWFLPDNTVTRGQIAKIVSNTFFPVNCAPRGRDGIEKTGVSTH